MRSTLLDCAPAASASYSSFFYTNWSFCRDVIRFMIVMTNLLSILSPSYSLRSEDTVHILKLILGFSIIQFCDR